MATRIFISLPMTGRSDEEISKHANRMAYNARIHFGNEAPIEIVHNHTPGQKLPKRYKTPRVYNLGKALEKMSTCDYIIFSHDYYDSTGCQVEEFVAKNYGLRIYYEDRETHKFVRKP